MATDDAAHQETGSRGVNVSINNGLLLAALMLYKLVLSLISRSGCGGGGLCQWREEQSKVDKVCVGVVAWSECVRFCFVGRRRKIP